MKTHSLHADNGAIQVEIDPEPTKTLECAAWICSIKDAMDLGIAFGNGAYHERPVRDRFVTRNQGGAVQST